MVRSSILLALLSLQVPLLLAGCPECKSDILEFSNDEYSDLKGSGNEEGS